MGFVDVAGAAAVVVVVEVRWYNVGVVVAVAGVVAVVERLHHEDRQIRDVC